MLYFIEEIGVTDEELFEYSRELNQLLVSARDLLSHPSTKYYHFVQNSPWGFDCKYAQAIAKEVPEDQVQLSKLLHSMQDILQRLL
jgi:hypothetical protein